MKVAVLIILSARSTQSFYEKRTMSEIDIVEISVHFFLEFLVTFVVCAPLKLLAAAHCFPGGKV